MKNLYARYAVYSLRMGILGIITLTVIAYLTHIGFFSDYELLGIVGISTVFSFGGATYFKQTSAKLPEFTSMKTHTDFRLKEFNFQNDVSLVPRLYLVSHEGEQLYVIEPTLRKPIFRFFTVFNFVASGWTIPITYDVMSLDRSQIFSFTVKNEWKQFRITVLNERDETIAIYVQNWLKSVVKNKGTLYHSDQSIWREIASKNMSGDIDIRDDENRVTASYRFGIFPYTLNPAFQALSNNIHIKLGPQISMDERKTYLALFYFWLYGKR